MNAKLRYVFPVICAISFAISSATGIAASTYLCKGDIISLWEIICSTPFCYLLLFVISVILIGVFRLGNEISIVLAGHFKCDIKRYAIDNNKSYEIEFIYRFTKGLLICLLGFPLPILFSRYASDWNFTIFTIPFLLIPFIIDAIICLWYFDLSKMYKKYNHAFIR